MKSKENNILELFLDYPTKQWHFEEIIKETKIARSKAARWLNLFLREKLIKKIRVKGRMPYFISNYNMPEYIHKKRIFALQALYESGLLGHLSSIENASSIILFGSFSRGDWYKGSDIDIFIYGHPENLRLSQYEIKLKRDIELFICKDKEELSKYGEGLIKNIIKGDIIKGDIDFIEVKPCILIA